MLQMVNNAFHFVLELAAAAALVYWGFHSGDIFWKKILLGVILPLAALTVWGVFRVPGDPGPATVAVPGWLRLILELGLLTLAGFALAAAGKPGLAQVYGVAVLINYVIMYERILWLLKQ